MADRQHEVTRIEGFSDAVFGFALTLLVISLAGPTSLVELELIVRRSVPFALTFAMICYIWWEHNVFFRRYGLQDAWTAFLNSVLLFVVLFYVYPLKYLATALLGAPLGLPPDEIPQMSVQPRLVMLLYSSGVVLIFGLFVMLYRHAWSKRGVLELSLEEPMTLRYKQRAHVISATLGALSIALASFISEPLMWVPGVLYGLMGPLHAANGYMAGKAHSRLDGSL